MRLFVTITNIGIDCIALFVYRQYQSMASPFFGLAITMDNAPAEVKAVADYITPDADPSGLAVAISKFLYVRLHILAFC